jgi:hypothetical protein
MSLHDQALRVAADLLTRLRSVGAARKDFKTDSLRWALDARA